MRRRSELEAWGRQAPELFREGRDALISEVLEVWAAHALKLQRPVSLAFSIRAPFRFQVLVPILPISIMSLSISSYTLTRYTWC